MTVTAFMKWLDFHFTSEQSENKIIITWKIGYRTENIGAVSNFS